MSDRMTNWSTLAAPVVGRELSAADFGWNHLNKRDGMYVTVVFPGYPFATCNDKRNCTAKMEVQLPMSNGSFIMRDGSEKKQFMVFHFTVTDGAVAVTRVETTTQAKKRLAQFSDWLERANAGEPA
jgi:hypothetical protein